MRVQRLPSDLVEYLRVTPAPAATRSSPATGANPAESTRTRIRAVLPPASHPATREREMTHACSLRAGARAHGGTNDDRCTGMRRPTSSPPAHSRAHPVNSSDPSPSSNNHRIAQHKACRIVLWSLITTPLTARPFLHTFPIFFVRPAFLRLEVSGCRITQHGPIFNPVCRTKLFHIPSSPQYVLSILLAPTQSRFSRRFPRSVPHLPDPLACTAPHSPRRRIIGRSWASRRCCASTSKSTICASSLVTDLTNTQK